MRLRSRVLLVVATITAVLLTGQYVLSNGLLLGNYRDLEQDSMRRDVQRATRALDQLVEDLHVKTVDWAEWDDTYRFMKDHNTGYVRSNLLESGLATMHLDLVVYCDLRWRIVRAFPVHRVLHVAPPDPSAAVREIQGLRCPGAAPTSRLGLSGLVEQPNGPLLVSARPILTTSGRGPAQGWLVFGRYFDREMEQKLGGRTRMDVHFHDIPGGRVPRADLGTLSRLCAHPGTLVWPQDGERIAAASLVSDLSSRPLLLLEVHSPRLIYQQGLRASRYLVSLIGVASLVFSVVVLVLLERLVLSRVLALSMQVQHIAIDGSWIERVRLGGGDELAALGERINAMLDAQARLHESQQEEARLRAHNEELEAEVAERVRQIEHQALHDPLTELPNRALFLDRLGLALRRARRSHIGVAVLYLDVDDFKNVNDSKGHEAGDHLLMEVAVRLRGSVRPGDTVSRLGGDEFTVVLEELHSVAEAEEVAERVVGSLRSPIHIPPDEVFASGSIGIAYSALADSDAETLLRNADTAMYVAKANGKGGYATFHQGMNDRVVARVEIETGLRRALDGGGELCVYYQPVWDLATGRAAGVEALVRWQHPSQGLMHPAQFIPIAEDSGLIIPLGYWVLERACRDMRSWLERRGDEAPATVSVNLSGKQLMRPGLVGRVAEILQRTGLEARYLTLEVTESVLAADVEGASTRLRQLRDLGVRLAMDDFGTGYSSLASLQSLPLDAVKIDRAFIARLSDGDDAAAVVAAIITLARTMRLGVTAEGIETVRQLERLRELGCTTGQGYLLARPMPADDLATLEPGLLHHLWIGDGDGPDELRELSESLQPAILRAA